MIGISLLDLVGKYLCLVNEYALLLQDIAFE